MLANIILALIPVALFIAGGLLTTIPIFAVIMYPKDFSFSLILFILLGLLMISIANQWNRALIEASHTAKEVEKNTKKLS